MAQAKREGTRGLMGALALIAGTVAMLAAGVTLAQPTPASASVAVEPGAGERIYTRYCATCHDQQGSRTPPRAALERLSPSRILRTMDFGLMMSVAYPMSREERESVAQYLGKGTEASLPPASAMCSDDSRVLAASTTSSWTSWSPSAGNTRFQDAPAAGLTAAQLPALQLRWAFGFPDDVIAFAAPTLLRGTLFVGSAGGRVQALDAQTGCIHWTFEANGPVRTPPTIAQDGARQLLLFTDQIGGVYALDAVTGQQAWRMKVETHDATRLSGTIVVHGDVAYVPAASWEETRSVDPAYVCCTFRGSVSAVRVSDGTVLWKTWLVDEPRNTGKSAAGTDQYGPSGAGVWSAPTVDAQRGLLYVATGDNYSHPATATSDAVIALELATGRIVWTQQMLAGDVFNAQCPRGAEKNCGPDFDFAAPVMLVRTPSGSEVLVAGQKSGVAFGLDPDEQGKILWETRVGIGGTAGGIQWGMASDGRYAFAATADAVRTVGDPSSPQIGNAIFDPVKGGGLTAIDVLTGRKVWYAPSTPCLPDKVGCSPAQPGAVTAIPGVVFSGAMDGHLRAFSTEDGSQLWDMDTQRSYTTVNGVSAQGGSLDGAGPIVADGMVYVNSGYPRLGGVPGNVLLAFGLDSSVISP
jgi:polyvinyl alcohol dehydrogenase (cytochrome)